MIATIARASVLALVITLSATGGASARSAYDGSWSLTIVTQRGACDPSYNFQVNIRNGVVSHPNIVRLHGRVTAKGAVRVSVAVPGKFASGSGRLRGSSGRGRWSGHADRARCSGYWSAQKS